VLREITFSDFLMNDAGFEEARSSAYSSDHQMLRDTDKGFRYLEKTPTGERQIKEEINTKYLFALGGILYDPSLDNPVPCSASTTSTTTFSAPGCRRTCSSREPCSASTRRIPNIGGTGIELGSDVFLTGRWTGPTSNS
jgi:hypothetical protein